MWSTLGIEEPDLLCKEKTVYHIYLFWWAEWKRPLVLTARVGAFHLSLIFSYLTRVAVITAVLLEQDDPPSLQLQVSTPPIMVGE